MLRRKEVTTLNRVRYHIVSVCALSIMATVSAADPWADSVVSYDPGSNPAVGYTIESSVLGAPTSTSTAFGGYLVSPFSPPGGTEEILSIGEGGSVVVRFDEPVMNDPNNPFGIDLLVFGNSFFSTSDFNFDDSTTVTGTASEGGTIEISDDGVSFVPVVGDADGEFPTNGFADTNVFFPVSGSVVADFTLPVDPAFHPVGLGAAEIYAGYNGSGGGAGIDIGSYGLSSVSYVRVSNALGVGCDSGD